MNFREGKTVIKDNYVLTPKNIDTRNNYDTFTESRSVKSINTLRIRGSKAPEAEMVDHWKKSIGDASASAVFSRSSR